MMEYKRLPNGFAIPALGMGTWRFGGRDTHDPANDDAAQLAALRLGLDSGFTLVDTAEYYADGYAETLVGEAIRHRDRSKLFLTSKVWKTHLRRADTIRACENSLRRLGTPYLDLYLYHQVSEDVPLRETIDAMNELVRRGLVRHIGVSNFAPERLRRAMEYSESPVVLNQVHYSLAVRAPEKELLAFCAKHGVMLQAWRPVRDVAACPLTDRMCEKYNCTLAQLAIAWVLSQENTAAVAAAMTPAHIRENLSAASLRLTHEDTERLRAEMPGTRENGAVLLS